MSKNHALPTKPSDFTAVHQSGSTRRTTASMPQAVGHFAAIFSELLHHGLLQRDILLSAAVCARLTMSKTECILAVAVPSTNVRVMSD